MPYIKGKWKWQTHFEDIDYQVQCQCRFVSNGETFYGIGFGCLNDGRFVLEYERLEGSATAGSSYYEEYICYVLDDYRVMDFGDTEQYIDRMLHEFILDHAEPYFTIAEKLVQIAENEKAVYQSGYDKALEKGGYNQGFEDGKQAEYDAFWDAYQPYKGNAHYYQYAFCNEGWNDETFKPKYDIVFARGYSGNNTFWSCAVTDLAAALERQKVKLDTTFCGFMSATFQLTKTKRIPEINCSHVHEYGNNLTNTFDSSLVETIDKLIVTETLGYTNTFNKCANLKNIVFEGVIGQNINFQWSTLLTRASIESVVNHLSDTASGKTLTLSLTAIKTAFGADPHDWDGDGIKDGWIGSSEWIDLISTKPNWNIVGV